jgi:hypothetical protein
MEENKGRNNPDKVRGFYYDHQIYNPLYTISLHANTRPKPGKDAVIWDENMVEAHDGLIMSSLTGPDHTQQHWDNEWDDFFTGGFSTNETGKNGGKLPVIHDGSHASYYAEPICSSIFSEDFNFSIANEWTSWDGGNFLENLFKSVKPYAPMVGTMTKALSGLNEKDVKGDWAKWMTSGAKKLGEWLDDTGIESTLNKALYIQGTRYSMYNGTSTNFGNMSMKFTLLSDWKPEYPGSKTYRFMTVYDQFAYIYPYCTGLWEPDGKAGPAHKFAERVLTKKMQEMTDPFITEYVGWQSPPGGFKSINRNIDVQQEGTLRLMLGGFYTIDNLVIKNISVNMSRQLCKCPVKGYDGLMVPLYADIVIELQPVSVYTDVSLGRFLRSDGMNEIHIALKKAIEDQNKNNKEGQFK